MTATIWLICILSSLSTPNLIIAGDLGERLFGMVTCGTSTKDMTLKFIGHALVSQLLKLRSSVHSLTDRLRHMLFC